MRTVMAFGTFDGLHEGHRFFLCEARKLGDSLIAVVARDETVQALKHKYPKHPLGARIAAIREAGLADVVVPGDVAQGSWRVLQKYRPAVVAIGYDQDALGHALREASPRFPFSIEIVRIRRYGEGVEMTQLDYLDHFTLTESDTEVVDVITDDGKQVVLLDQTIFYPQGGGQPYDTGVIASSAARFLVEEVRFVDGLVRHIGRFESGSFKKGERVHLVVDAARRLQHSKIHSAGHVVDMAVKTIGLTWVPGKGYHFPQGPYVEYTGDIEGYDRERLCEDLERRAAQLIERDAEVTVKFVSVDEMRRMVSFVPDNIPIDKPSRVVCFDDFCVPCGGTHVRRLSEIGRVMIRKIKSEKHNIRVGYDVMQ